MNRRIRRIIDQSGLNEIEAEYLTAVHAATVGVPRSARRAFAADTAELLAGRPTPERPADLVDALGQPTRYARQWRVEEGLDRWIPPWQRWWRQSRRARVAQVTVIVALIVATGMVRSYYGATIEVGNNCSGARGPEVEMLRAAGAMEYRMPFEQGARYGIHLCPGVPEGVTIERVYLASPGEIGVQPVGYEVAESHAVLGIVGDASKREPIEDGYRQMTVWFEGEYCNHYGGGGGFALTTLSVDYRYRGRVRTTTVPLEAHYTFSYDDNHCHEDDRRDVSNRWRSVVGEAVWGIGREGLGDLALTPESISRDLCRHLRGIVPPAGGYDEFEPLESRAVFQLSRTSAEPLIDGAIFGVCPEFQDRQEELYALIGEWQRRLDHNEEGR